MTLNNPAVSPAAVAPTESTFQSNKVLSVVSGHSIHDTYSAFLAPLLPGLIEKLSLSYTQVGMLSGFMQLPSLLNPLIGYLDDKINLRLLVILAPAVTATTMSSLGLAPNFFSLAVLLFITGISIAAFHAPSPAMVARASGRYVGRGMSYYMAAGELGRTVGPLLASWAVIYLTLDRLYVLAPLGWAASLVIYLLFRDVTIHVQKQSGFREMLPAAKRLFIPLMLVSFGRTFLITSLSVYLPTLMQSEGASQWAAGSALAIYQFAGVGGALLGGTVSDRLGRKPVLFFVTLISPLLVFVFLNTSGWLLFATLIAVGFLSLSAQPIMLAIVQDHLPNHRSVANGFFMGMSFILQALAALGIGILGDLLSLRAAYAIAALVNLAAVPFVMLIPRLTGKQGG